MKFNIHGSKIDVTDAIKNYIVAKIGKLDKYFNNSEDLTTNVTIKVHGKDQIVEVTILAGKFVLRAEDRNNDLYAAIDLVSEKLERQIRKNKTKARKSMKQAIVFNDFGEDEVSEEEIIKRKTIDTKPMSEEEAILQMELTDHDFFLFKNEANDKFCVVYKRKNGGYGILEAK